MNQKHENKVFEDQPVQIDGDSFRKCVFRRCLIKYSALAPVALSGCIFDSCEFGFDGPAGLTLQFMSALYQIPGYGKLLVERTFENIKQGILGKTASMWIECPVKKVRVKVGEMDRATFDALDLGTQSLACRECGQTHSWTKADVILGPPSQMPVG